MTLTYPAEAYDDRGEAISLDPAAHALLTGLRMIVVGRGECPALRRIFVEVCGASGDEAVTSLFVVVKQVAFRSRRKLSVHAPGCRGISSDELIFLSALAAAQQPEINGQGRERLWLASLLGTEADGAIAGSLRSLAGLLSSAGLRLDMDDWRPAFGHYDRSRSLH